MSCPVPPNNPEIYDKFLAVFFGNSHCISQEFAVILMDVNMPGGTGLNALQKIKSSSKTQLIPVIVVSGVDDATLPKKVLDLGAIDFIKSNPAAAETAANAELASFTGKPL